MNLKKAILSSFLFLQGCGTAWVVERNADGGVIGYRGYQSSESAEKAIADLIPCKDYRGISDKLVDGGTSTYYVPMVSSEGFSGTGMSSNGSFYYSGQQTKTQYVPVETKNFWRAFTYTCVSEFRSMASLPGSSTPPGKVESCQDF